MGAWGVPPLGSSGPLQLPAAVLGRPPGSGRGAGCAAARRRCAGASSRRGRAQAPGCPPLPSCSNLWKREGAALCPGLCEEGKRLAGPPAARWERAVLGPAPLCSLPPLGSAFCQGSAACPQLEQSLPSLPVFPTSRSCVFVLRSVCSLPPLLLRGRISALSHVRRGCRGAPPAPPPCLSCRCFAVSLRPEAPADGCWLSGVCLSPAAETSVRLACGGWEPRRRAVLLQLVSVGIAPTPGRSRATGPQSLHCERALQ